MSQSNAQNSAEQDELVAKFLEAAANIKKIQNGFEVWQRAGFPEKTLLVLLAHSTGLAQKTCRTVLAGMSTLHDDYFAVVSPPGASGDESEDPGSGYLDQDSVDTAR